MHVTDLLYWYYVCLYTVRLARAGWWNKLLLAISYSLETTEPAPQCPGAAVYNDSCTSDWMNTADKQIYTNTILPSKTWIQLCREMQTFASKFCWVRLHSCVRTVYLSPLRRKLGNYGFTEKNHKCLWKSTWLGNWEILMKAVCIVNHFSYSSMLCLYSLIPNLLHM